MLTLWPFTPAAGIVGDALALAGLVLSVWARITLGTNWSANVVVKEDHAIIDRGPYRSVRHPIYSGVLLMILGTAVLWGTLAGFLLLVVALAGFAVKARSEERLLTEYLGDSYSDYKRRVRWAVIPRVL